MPMMVVELNGRSRFTSVKRAREPYDARREKGSARWHNGDLGSQAELDEPRLSAAMTTPSLNFTATTEVPVTTGD